MWVTATHCRKIYQIVDLPDYWITESTIKNRFESNLFIIRPSYDFLRNKNIEGILVLTRNSGSIPVFRPFQHSSVKKLQINRNFRWSRRFLVHCFYFVKMQNVINAVKGTALNVAEKFTPVLKVSTWMCVVL